MKATQTLVNKIKEFEGCKLKAYLCPAGKWTIGYGHTKYVKDGMTISQGVADEMLLLDIEEFERQMLNAGVPKGLNAHQWDALVDFAFNLGVANLASSTLLKKIKAKASDKEICAEFKRWVYTTKYVKNKATGKTEKKKVELPGLVKRRNWEALRWEGKA